MSTLRGDLEEETRKLILCCEPEKSWKVVQVSHSLSTHHDFTSLFPPCKVQRIIAAGETGPQEADKWPNLNLNQRAALHQPHLGDCPAL